MQLKRTHIENFRSVKSLDFEHQALARFSNATDQDVPQAIIPIIEKVVEKAK